MRIEIEIQHKPEKNDIVIFDGKKWININFNQLVEPIKKDALILSERVFSLEKEIKRIKGE